MTDESLILNWIGKNARSAVQPGSTDEHVWRGTGNTGDSSELDLAGLVCNKLGNHQCINPMKGKQGGQTWEYRAGYIDGMISEKRKIDGRS